MRIQAQALHALGIASQPMPLSPFIALTDKNWFDHLKRNANADHIVIAQGLTLQSGTFI